MTNKRRLRPWMTWLLFGGALVVVFLLGLFAASITERRAEVQSIFANKPVNIKAGEARNELFQPNYPREYETWTMTADTSFESKHNGSKVVDMLAQRPAMVIFWAGYAFSREYGTPRGHMHAIEDVRNTLRTGTPGIEGGQDMQPATCWTCKSPDVPRVMQEIGVSEYYAKRFHELGDEVVNPIGCADCHETKNMELQISRPALVEAFARQGKDITKATHQEMRSLVCAQCHVEYYFSQADPNKPNYLTFPWDNGYSMEDAEKYFDDLDYYDYIHPLSKAKILKAQHPDFEIAQKGIHAQRGVSCADCHMPYMSEGGVKFSDHHITSPLRHIDRTCQTCHRESEETLRQNVYDRQEMALEVRDNLESELCKAHLEAQFAWNHEATEEEMAPILKLIRQSQWRWDYAVATHGGSFHAPQEVTRILSAGLQKALQARVLLAQLVAKHGHIGAIPLPDVSTKELAQKYIGLDMNKLYKQKEEFKEKVIPQWIQQAKEKGTLYTATAKQ